MLVTYVRCIKTGLYFYNHTNNDVNFCLKNYLIFTKRENEVTFDSREN